MAGNRNIGEKVDIWRWPSQNYGIVLGDTNARFPLWNENVPNRMPTNSGSVFKNWMASKNISQLNNGSPTYFSRKTDKGAVSGISFLHSSLLDKSTWKAINDLGPSANHYQV